MLVKVFLRNGKEEWILVHTEIQGTNDKRFAERIFQYWYRIYDRYQVDITVLAVLTGGKNQKRTSVFPKLFLGTEINYRFSVYHIFDHTEEALLAMDNPFALIVLAARRALLAGKIQEKGLNRQRLRIATKP